jgi:subtilisin-like proprotein convertase family protein
MADGGPGDFGTLISWSITVDYTTPGGGGGPVLSYVWSPLAGLYIDAAACIPYTGTNTPVVYAAPSALTVYTVTATDVATGCIGTASVTVNYTPPPPTIVPSSVTMCLGDPAVKLKSSSSQGFSQTYSSGTVNINIPDGPTIPPVPTSYPAVISDITVSGIPAGATITGVRARLNITHVWVSDLVIALKAPNGKIINLDALVNRTNNPGANFTNTVISSAGTATLNSAPAPYTGTFRADLAGATFTALGFTWPGGPVGYVPNAAAYNELYNAGPVNGVWSIGIYDAGAPDGGTLNNWSLDVDWIVGVPATPAVWSPAAGLFSNAAATIPYVAGTMVDSVWTRPTPQGVYPYQVTVNNVVSSGAQITLPPHVNTFTGNVRGYWFTAPSAFTISSVEVPTDASTGAQSIAVVRFTGATPPPAFPGTTNAFTTLFLTQNNPATGSIPVNIAINAGDVIGLMGYRATVNSYSGLPPNTTVINGTTVNLTRMGMQFPLTTTAPQDIWQEPAGAISRVLFSTAVTGPGTCTSPARTVVVTVNQPVALSPTLPVAQTVCTDKVATFSVAITQGTGPFTYQWQTRTNVLNSPWGPVSNGGVYSGATTATLTITAPPVSLNGNFYRAVVGGAAPCAAATSDSAQLTVNPLPVIVISASPLTSLFPGLTTTLSSTVSPNPATTYTWIRDGINVPGGNTATLGVDIDGLGDYQLRVTDVNGCTNISNIIAITDSANAKCFVYPNPNSGQFQVRYHSAANNVLPRSLTIYDAKGDRVMTKFYTIGRPYDRMDVDMRAYGKGLYWVEIGDRNGNRITMCRVVIQ